MTSKPVKRSKDYITAFLPCRQGSERVPNKNIRPFGPYKYGLLEIKLKQLLACTFIDEIILSTNDDEIISYASSLINSRLTIHRRAENLSTSKTSTDDLIIHAYKLISSGHILWTHVTSPFVNEATYADIVASYFDRISCGFDSLMTVTPAHGFFWNIDRPINYDRDIEKWPRTQTVSPIFEVNSAVFLASVDIYRDEQDRIGKSPYLYQLDRFKGYDIDWNEDFLIAEQLLLSNIVSV